MKRRLGEFQFNLLQVLISFWRTTAVDIRAIWGSRQSSGGITTADFDVQVGLYTHFVHGLSTLLLSALVRGDVRHHRRGRSGGPGLAAEL
jgi:hypothetical protein